MFYIKNLVFLYIFHKQLATVKHNSDVIKIFQIYACSDFCVIYLIDLKP